MTYLIRFPNLAVLSSFRAGQCRKPEHKRRQAGPEAALAALAETDGDALPIDRRLPRRLRREGWWLES